MSRTIAIFGAGPALGMALGRRFGREGFQVALVARTQARLDGYVRDLADEGVEAAGFSADLTDHAAAVATLHAIEAEMGEVEVLEYSPGPLDVRVVPAPQVEVEDLEPMLDLRLRTPVALARAALPGMLDRGRGALLFAFGAQPRYPDPMLDNVGVAQAALLHHVHNLHMSLKAGGVYAGALLIAGLIDGSEIQRLLREGQASHLPDGVDVVDLPVIAADRLAEAYWDLYVARDRVEQLVGAAEPRTRARI